MTKETQPSRPLWGDGGLRHDPAEHGSKPPRLVSIAVAEHHGGFRAAVACHEIGSAGDGVREQIGDQGEAIVPLGWRWASWSLLT